MSIQTLKRNLALFGILVALLLALGACAPASQEAPAEPAETTSEEAAEPAASEAKEEEAQAPAEEMEEVTITWFMRWDKTRVENVAMPVIEAFEAEHPNIHIEFENVGKSSEYYQKLQTMTAGGLAPDVFYPATHIAYAFAMKDAIRFVDDFIARDNLDMSQYDPYVLSLYQLDGLTYCLPIDTAALVVFYNKDMFDASGVAYPQDGWTWDDFLETAKALTQDTDGDGQVDQFGVDDFTGYWPIVVWTKSGHPVFNDLRQPTEFLLTDQESIDAIQWLADLSLVHGVMPNSAQRADIGDMFVAGKAAMKIIGHWRVPRYLANADFKFDFAPIPKGKIAANRADGSCFAISASSKHPEAAWEFVKFLAGPGSIGVEKLLELQQMVPAIVEYQSSGAFLNPPQLEGANKKAFLAGKEHLFSNYDPLHPVYDEWKSLFRQEFGEVWLGNTTAQEAIEYMAPLVDEMLANLEDYE